MLETKRLILRKWTDEDADSLFEYAKDPDVGPIAGWPPHASREESLRVIQNVLNNAECYAICEKGNGKAIGAIELKLNGHTDMTEREDACELGYWLGKPYWGRGYMPEAAREIIRHGFEDLGMNTIWCGYYEGNQKSKRVQEKLGFTYHHTCDEVPVPLMNEVRIGHTNILKREDWENAALEGEEPWRVYFDGGYFGKQKLYDRPGKEIVLNTGFTWNDEIWHIPAVYIFSKGVVVDFCVEIAPEREKAFIEKWETSEIAEECLTRENPLNIEFYPYLTVNGKLLSPKGSTAISWIPASCLPSDVQNDRQSARIIKHYGLDETRAWSFHRTVSLWTTARRPTIKSMSLKLKREAAQIDGICFKNPSVGDVITFTHPVFGTEHQLTVLEYEQQEFLSSAFLDPEYEFPTHHTAMTYTLEPDIPNKNFQIRDCLDNDAPKRRPKTGYEPQAAYEASAISIIGGADGPTAILLSTRKNSTKAVSHAALSALHFEPTNDVVWKMVFREKLVEDMEVDLLEREISWRKI